MDRLPNEIVTDILLMFPIKSVLRFRSVCKSWCNIIDDPEFATIHFTKANQADTKSPFLIVPSKGRRVAIFLVELLNKQDSISHLLNTNPRKRKRKKPSLFSTTKINFSGPRLFTPYTKPFVNGLFCFSTHCFRTPYQNPFTYIYNPVTQHFLELPKFAPLQLKQAFQIPGFGFVASSNEYKVVQFLYWQHNGRLTTEAQVFSLGSNSWRRLENVPETVVYCGESASLEGSLHWLTKGRHVLCFDLTSENFGFTTYPPFTILAGSDVAVSRQKLHILNLGGCLSIADSSYADHIEVWSMKEYNVTNSWTKLIVMRKYAVERKQLSKVVPISIWKKGEILLLYDSTTLVSYNVDTDIYTPLEVHDIPECRLEVYPFLGNLISLRTRTP